ncbi:hypothetical protein K8I28_16690 [bacterium]|nr:hypothetical protein [bacterium]
MNPIRINIICRGNMVRSPYIAGYLRYYQSKSPYRDKMPLEITSSGIDSKPNYPAHPEMLAKGHEVGFDLSGHRSTYASLKLLNKLDILLVTHTRQLKQIKETMPDVAYKTFHLAAFGREGVEEAPFEFEDPSQTSDTSSFENFFKIVEPEVERIWKFLEQSYLRSLKTNEPFSAAIFVPHDSLRSFMPKQYNFFTKRKFAMCPHCQSRRLRRMKRKGLLQNKLYPIFDGYPYHCGRCKKKFILFIGSKGVTSTRRKDKKEESWKKFIEKERERKG